MQHFVINTNSKIDKQQAVKLIKKSYITKKLINVTCVNSLNKYIVMLYV